MLITLTQTSRQLWKQQIKILEKQIRIRKCKTSYILHLLTTTTTRSIIPLFITGEYQKGFSDAECFNTTSISQFFIPGCIKLQEKWRGPVCIFNEIYGSLNVLQYLLLYIPVFYTLVSTSFDSFFTSCHTVTRSKKHKKKSNAYLWINKQHSMLNSVFVQTNIP